MKHSFTRRPYAVIASALALLVVDALPTSAAPPSNAPQRIHQRIDSDWRFLKVNNTSNAGAVGTRVVDWKWRADPRGLADADAMSAPSLDTSTGWQAAKVGEDVFGAKPGWVWFRANLTQHEAPKSISFDSVDDNAWVYLNGKLLTHHEGWSDPFSVDVTGAWKPDGPNVLAVLVQNNDGVGGLGGDVVLSTGRAATPQEADEGFDASKWQSVHLPHDFVVEGQFSSKADGGHGFLPTGAGWYRKTLDIPASAKGRRLWLGFDGIYRDSRVWLNGHLLGRHPCGYTGFRYDVTDFAKPGAKNTIAVLADARKPEGWWYEGGGIYRHVWFDIVNPVSVAPSGTFVKAAVKGLDAGQTPSADLSISTTVSNAGSSPAKVTVTSKVVRPDGSVAGTAASGATIEAGKSADIAQSVADAKAALWSLEKPQLYRLETTVLVDGKAVDELATPFGVRSIRFDVDKGFMLNEKPVKIKGTCNHQDFAGVGVALPDGILAWRVTKLKSMGSNAYRTSHNEVAPELLDECDRQGMLVMDETRHFGDGEGGKAGAKTTAEDLDNLREQVLRDRNHPSVVMWSIGNEEWEQGTENGKKIGTAMKALIDKLDGSRPTTEAVNSRHGEGASTVIDIEGFNYWPGGYDKYHQSHPKQPIIGSETASALSTRGVYTTETFSGAGVKQRGDKANGWVTAYDLNGPSWGQTAEDAWRPIAERPFVSGGFVWTGFDYRGEPTPFDWPCVNSAFGILDMCGFPKDSFYYYQAVWGDKPMVHIFPHWNWPGKEGTPIDVWAYSNADRVELFLNGTSLGIKPMPTSGHASWQVPYAPGTLSAKAFSGDSVTATDTITTTGAPVAIRLRTDRPSLLGDGEDESPVEVSIVDVQGRVVPTADNLVTFRIAGTGTIAGVGNGNPSSHEPDVATQRHAFNGLCMAVVRSAEGSGTITLTATADGLKPATISVSVK